MSRPHNGAPTAAAFGRLRDELWVRVGADAPRVILVASAAPAEGRTVVAAGLARAFAEADSPERTVLVDADLRRPALHRLFGLDRAPGLSEVLRGASKAEAAMRAVADGRLLLLPAGSEAADACALVASGTMGTVINDLRNGARVVILDSPPAESAVEVQALAGMADAVLLVVRADRTVEKDAFNACARLRERGNVNILGVVLNDVRLGRAHRL